MKLLDNKMNKKGSFVDLFVFIIFAFIVAIIIVVFLYIGSITTTQLHASMDDMNLSDGTNNVSVVIDNTMGVTYSAYQTMRWTGILIFFGMIIGIFIGSYMVQTKPIFFIPYIFIVIIAIVVSVGIANAFELLMATEDMASTFAQTTAINWFILQLPIIVTITGFIGGLIMFSKLGKGEQQHYAYQ